MGRTRRKVEQVGSKIGYWTKRGGAHGEFVELTNFGLRMLKFVQAPAELPEYSGFIVEVTQELKRRGTVKGECFLPWYEVNSSEQLRKFLGDALPGGALVCNLESSDIKSFMMDLWKEFYECDDGSDDEPESCKPVVCMGRQPGSDIFVLGPNLQFKSDGTAIPPQEQEFMWIPRVLKKLKISHIIHPFSLLPHVAQPMNRLINGLLQVMGDNWPSAVFVLGAAVISLFYESVLKTCGSVGVHIAYGEVSKGKSNAAKIALAAACNLSHGFQTYLSDSVARQHLSGALPFVFDDPSNNAVLKQILINAFGGAEMATQRSHFSARCVPIVTANTFAVDELTEVDPRYLGRAVLNPFVFDPANVELGVLSNIIEDAPAAFPMLLAVGRKLELMSTEMLSELQEKVANIVEIKMDSRLCTQYCIALFCAEEIIQISGEESVSAELIWEHFREVIVPEVRVRQIQQRSSKIQQVDALGQQMTQFSKAASQSEVLTVINPDVKYHVKRTSESERERMKGIAIRLKEFLGKLDKYSIAHDTERNLRKWIRGNDLCNSYMKQYFLRSNSTHTKILRSAPGTTCCKTCVCIAKQYIPDSFFECFSGSKFNASEQRDTNDIDDTKDSEGIVFEGSDEETFSEIVQELDDSGIAADHDTSVSSDNVKRKLWPSCENQAIALDASNWSPTQSPKSLPSPHHAAHGTPKSRLRVSPLGTPKSRLRVSPLGTPKSRLWVSLLGTPKSRLRVSPHGTPKSRLPVSPHGTPKSRLRVSPLGTPNSRLRVSPLAGTPKSRLRVSPLGTPKSRLQVSPLGRRVHNAHDEVPKLTLTTKNQDPKTFQKVATNKRAHRAANSTDKKSSSKCQKCGGRYLKKHSKKWVGCDYCWRWWHFNCLGLASLPDEKEELKCPVCSEA